MSKNKIESGIDIGNEIIEEELDNEYRENMINDTNNFNNEYELSSKCINICADIRTYLDKNALTGYIFKDLSVDCIKQFLSEISS